MIISHQHFDLLGKVVFERVVFTPPLKSFEAMEEEACFVYSINGHAIAYGGADRESIKPTEGVLVKCGSFINNWGTGENSTPYEAVAFHFYPEILKLAYKNEIPSFLKNTSSYSGPLLQKITTQKAIYHFIQNLLFYFDNPDLVNEELISLKLKELMLLLYQTDSPGVRPLLQHLFSPTIIAFKEVIHAHLCEDLSIEDLAKLTNHSLSSFKRKFKEVFKESPARYIKLKRLEKAAELLMASTKRISDICLDCGFKDLGHFSKSFVALYGLSPSEYRKNPSSQMHQ